MRVVTNRCHGTAYATSGGTGLSSARQSTAGKIGRRRQRIALAMEVVLLAILRRFTRASTSRSRRPASDQGLTTSHKTVYAPELSRLSQAATTGALRCVEAATTGSDAWVASFVGAKSPGRSSKA
jgi:hypothetical protein